MNLINYILKFIKSKFGLFLILLLSTLLFSYWLSGSFIPSNDSQNLWFYSGIFMVLVTSFFIEEYYSSPRNILANLLPLIVIFISVKQIFVTNSHQWLWIIGLSYVVVVLIASFFSIVLNNEDKNPENIQNKASELLKKFSVVFGKGKLVYSAMFLYFLLAYYSINEIKVLLLMLFWWFIIVAEPQRLVAGIKLKKQYPKNAIGKIIKVQSKKVFLVKLFSDSLSSKIYDIVKFKYAVQDNSSKICYGFIIEIFILDNEKWAKLLLADEEPSECFKDKCEKNVVYQIAENSAIELLIKRFVGIIVDGSNIGKINFECYSSNEIQEGNLLEVKVNSKIIYYQVIEGIAKEEEIEKKNERGFIKGEAIQLGTWNNKNCSFEKFGWVPDINSMVLLADTSGIMPPEINYPEYKLGIIPETTLPVVVNLEDAISHHFAILGVTGAGKSFITLEILNQLQNHQKIICVDFTGEYIVKLSSLSPSLIIEDKEKLNAIEKLIADKEDESKKYPKDRSHKAILEKKEQIKKRLNELIVSFMEGKSNIGIFELPDLSNTSFILEFTQFFLENVFNYAKENKDSKICLVLEEAHTVVPETTFLGDLGDFGSNKAIVSKIGQIALQGRKYGVGLIVIAQRTANVSKTVLTQCNTLLCFKAFDETSFTFIGNYLGKELVTTLPNLQKYHAIVTGKGVKSNIPVIVDLTREIKE